MVPGPERSSWCFRIAAASRCDCHAVEPLRIPGLLAARGKSPAAFEWRRIPLIHAEFCCSSLFRQTNRATTRVAPTGISPRRALRWPDAALLRPDLGATRGSTTGCENLAHLAARENAQFTQPLPRREWTNTSLCNRRETSVGSADSKNSSNASIRLVLAISTVWPWLAMSSSGQRATYASPSRSIMAVNWRVDSIAR